MSTPCLCTRISRLSKHHLLSPRRTHAWCIQAFITREKIAWLLHSVDICERESHGREADVTAAEEGNEMKRMGEKTNGGKRGQRCKEEEEHDIIQRTKKANNRLADKNLSQLDWNTHILPSYSTQSCGSALLIKCDWLHKASSEVHAITSGRTWTAQPQC